MSSNKEIFELNNELAPKSVRINSINPDFVPTKIVLNYNIP